MSNESLRCLSVEALISQSIRSSPVPLRRELKLHVCIKFATSLRHPGSPSDLHTGMHPGFDDLVSHETSRPLRDLGLAPEWVVQSYSHRMIANRNGCPD
jgi:hypothetical protein